MLKFLMHPAKAAVLALGVLLATAERSEAQWFVYRPSYGLPWRGWGGGWGGPVNPYFTWGGGPMNGWGGWGGSWYNYSYSYRYWYYTPPAITFVRYVPTQVEPAIPAGPATIEVTLPATAELWFDGNKTTQSGGVRSFKTPVLTPGRTYTYDLRASWQDSSGATVTQNYRVDVWAGQKSLVYLAQPNVAAKQP